MTNRQAVGSLCAAAFCAAIAGLIAATSSGEDEVATLAFRLAVAFGLIGLGVLAWNLSASDD